MPRGWYPRGIEMETGTVANSTSIEIAEQSEATNDDATRFDRRSLRDPPEAPRANPQADPPPHILEPPNRRTDELQPLRVAPSEDGQASAQLGARPLQLMPVTESTFRGDLIEAMATFSDDSGADSLTIAVSSPGFRWEPIASSVASARNLSDAIRAVGRVAAYSEVRDAALTITSPHVVSVVANCTLESVVQALGGGVPDPSLAYVTADRRAACVWVLPRACAPQVISAVRVQLDGSLIGIRRQFGAIPVPVDPDTEFLAGEPIDLQGWQPALPPTLEHARIECGMPELRTLPLYWWPIDWWARWVCRRWTDGTDAAAAMLAYLNAHVASILVMSGWACDNERAWELCATLGAEYVDRYMPRDDDPFGNAPLKLAFNIQKSALVALESSGRLVSWFTNEPAWKKVASCLTPRARLQWEPAARGSKTKELTCRFLPPTNAATSLAEIEGSSDARRAHGIVHIDSYSYPIAWKTGGYGLTDRGVVTLTVVPDPPIPGQDADSMSARDDPMRFLLAEYRALRTPFRTENDVRAYAMFVATPLLRAACPGRLPAYFMVGSSGSGKGLAKEAAFKMWQNSAAPGAPTSSYMSVEAKNETELRLKYAAMDDQLFMNLNEAVKSNTMELIVTQNERETVSARAHHRAPQEIANRYVTVADAVEGMPAKVEVERRTIKVHMRPSRTYERKLEPAADDENVERFRPSRFLRKMIEVGPSLIEGFRLRLEAEGPDFLERMSDDSGRSMATNALARLCGYRLGAVVGGGLPEIWNMILAATIDGVPRRSGDGQGFDVQRAVRSKAQARDPYIAQKFSVYSYAEVVAVARNSPAHQELAAHVRGNTLEQQIETEFGKDLAEFRKKGGRVLVVPTPEREYVYAPVRKQTFVFHDYGEVSAWVLATFGDGAAENLERLRVAGRRRFEMFSDEYMALDRLVAAIGALQDRDEDYETTGEDPDVQEVFDAIANVVDVDLASGKLELVIRMALVKQACMLATRTALAAELEVLSTDDLTTLGWNAFVDAGVVDAADDPLAAEVDVSNERFRPMWDSFRCARLLAPLASTRHREVFVDLARRARVLSPDSDRNDDLALKLAESMSSGVSFARLLRDASTAVFAELQPIVRSCESPAL